MTLPGAQNCSNRLSVTYQPGEELKAATVASRVMATASSHQHHLP